MNDFPPIMAITGATGFLGSRIALLACSLGWRIRIITRKPQDAISSSSEVVSCEYQDAAKLRSAFEGADVVLHCAGLAHVTGSEADESQAFLKANGEATGKSALAAKCAGVRHFVLVSSVSVYGIYDGLVADEWTPCHPKGAYAQSKLAGEQQAAANLAGSCTALTILRMATLYGERDRGNIANLLYAIASKRFMLPGSGRNKKSLLYVGDAAHACIVTAGSAIVSGKVNLYNVSAIPRSMLDIVEIASTLLHRKMHRLQLPDSDLAKFASTLQRVSSARRVGSRLQTLLRNDAYSSALFEATFYFRCQTELAEGLRLQAAADPELRLCLSPPLPRAL